MADALYILKLRMNQNITKVINEQRLSSSPSALLHGYSSFTWLPNSPQMTCLPSSLPFTSRIITQGSGRLCLPACNCWYLSEHLVLLALADDDIELELQSNILDKLLNSEVPYLLKREKPDLPVFLC